MSVKSLIIVSCASVALAACASNKGPERSERRPMDPEQMERVYNRFVERWDYNQDGMATCDDIAIQRSRLFKRLDTDTNGELSSSEYRYAKFEDKSFMFFTHDRVDTDASTTINVDEFVAVTHSEFLNMDQDGDCLINQREAMMAMRDLRGGGSERGSRGEGGGRGKGGRGKGGRGGGMGGPMITE